jgi:hypothetical protein
LGGGGSGSYTYYVGTIANTVSAQNGQTNTGGGSGGNSLPDDVPLGGSGVALIFLEKYINPFY